MLQFPNDVLPMIPREQMPQVDEKFYTDMLVFLGNSGVRFSAGYIDPLHVYSHQMVDLARVAAMPKDIANKPTLISADPAMIDGNHRWAWHYNNKCLMPFIRIELPFFDALKVIRTYPRTYAYGDGAFHPESH
jgi:hypothetical protein